jgi:L-2-hydroxyglutarate oxidase LhgO
VDIAVIGGGIVGLATACALRTAFPRQTLCLFEKEGTLAHHQTGNNSGVIHSGIYYKPGSLKARLCVDGARRMYALCAEHGVQHRRIGKVIVASSEAELERMNELYRRAQANGVPGVERIDARQLREIEPHVRGVAALWSPNTGIADYVGVCNVLRQRLLDSGVQIALHTRVHSLSESSTAVTVQTDRGMRQARYVVACAGLHSDRLARLMGLASEVQIVPFRGEYYYVRPERSTLVRGLIYPVPDPNFPFLGVHFTTAVDGKVEAGPNAVLAFAREGYRMAQIDAGDLFQALNFPGFQRMAAKWWRTGAYEIYRSLSKHEFVNSLQKLLPAIRPDDLERGGAGVRAQAVSLDGSLVDDFKFVQSARSLHVINAPSPAATASLAIADEIAAQALPMLTQALA